MIVMLKLYGVIAQEPDESGQSGFSFEITTYATVGNFRKDIEKALDDFYSKVDWTYLEDIGTVDIQKRGAKIISKKGEWTGSGYSWRWLDKSKGKGSYRVRFDVMNDNKLVDPPDLSTIYYPGVGDIIPEDWITLDYDYNLGKEFVGHVYLSTSKKRRHGLIKREGDPFVQREFLEDDSWRIKCDQIRMGEEPKDMSVQFIGEPNLENFPYYHGVLFEYKDR
jgi:hypothetical protein